MRSSSSVCCSTLYFLVCIFPVMTIIDLTLITVRRQFYVGSVAMTIFGRLNHLFMGFVLLLFKMYAYAFWFATIFVHANIHCRLFTKLSTAFSLLSGIYNFSNVDRITYNQNGDGGKLRICNLWIRVFVHTFERIPITLHTQK